MVNFSGSVELSLHGSQIALATRDKVVTPPIFYPPVLIHNRPGSASLNSSLRNRFSSRNYYNFGSKKRPLSADSRFINNNLKENHRVKFDQKTYSSSSNIYKLLVAENTSKYWNQKSNRRMSEKLENPQKSVNDDSTSCGESIEEDVASVKIDNKEAIENGGDCEWKAINSNDVNEPGEVEAKSSRESSASSFKTSQIRRPDSLALDFVKNEGETNGNSNETPKKKPYTFNSNNSADNSGIGNGSTKKPYNFSESGRNFVSEKTNASDSNGSYNYDGLVNLNNMKNEDNHLGKSSYGMGSGLRNAKYSYRDSSYSSSLDCGKTSADSGLGKSSDMTLSSSSKKPYDLWVNSENCKKKEPLDLPGRVSFSNNDVYQIDYSDYEDQESESNNSMKYGKFKSKSIDSVKDNKSNEYVKEHYMESNSENEFEDFGRYKKSDSIKKTERNAKEEKSHHEANQIIEDYKKEIASLNQRREAEVKFFERNSSMSSSSPLKSSNLKNNTNSNLKFEKFNGLSFDDLQNDDDISIKKHFIDDDDLDIYHSDSVNNKASVIKNYYEPDDDFEEKDKRKAATQKADMKLNNSNVKSKNNIVWEKEGKLGHDKIKLDSSNPVIKNYLKTKETDNEKLNNRITITTANKRLNDLSKKSKNTKESNSGKPKSAGNTQKNLPRITNSAEKQKKPKSSSSTCMREDSNLDEFQIEKVVSWMSVHEEKFSEFEYNVGNNNANSTSHESIQIGSNSRSLVSLNDCLIERQPDTQTDTTYDDIVSIIKEIDQNKKDTASDFKSLKTDVEFKLNTILNSIESDASPTLTEENVHDSNDKLKEIFSYLDKVDSNCDKALINSKNIAPDSEHHELEFALEPDVIEDVPKIADLLVLPNHQLARRIVKLSLRANELSNAIQLSKEHVANVRNDKMKCIRLEKLNCQNRLKEQKKHYEEIVARHQNFIEQLIKDKAGLCEKVTQITRRIDSQNQAWEHRLKTEVERAKETAMAGEKIRRERWVRENTKKIKELTVKGLELEINKMTAQHKQEIEDMKKQNQIEIMKAVDETKSRFDKIERNIRDSYAEEREGAIERERKAIKDRYEKQMEDERKSFEQQRTRLIHEFECEKDRIYAEMREKEHQFELKREELINEKLEMLEDTKNTFKEKLKQREQKHEIELQKLQEQYEADFKIWKREYETGLKLRETERENVIRDQYRTERDRQIDAIIAKIDAESLKNQQDFDIKFKRMKEKYEQEIKELENSEKNIKEKYIDTRTRLAEVEANNQNLQATVKQLDLQLTHLNKLCKDYNQEKDHFKDEARNEIKNELKSINKEHEHEIQRIYSRVQQAISKKDATLETIQKENSMLKERCLKLDAIIRQQRKDYCTK